MGANHAALSYGIGQIGALRSHRAAVNLDIFGAFWCRRSGDPVARPRRVPSDRRPGRPKRGTGAGDGEHPVGASPVFRVGLCLPLRGSAGIWGPSCGASAQLAEAELNQSSGIARRPCELHLIDASDDSPDVEDTLVKLVEGGQVDALVGMCISSVRQRIVSAVGGSIPFVYTCLYEGGESTPR